MENPYSGIPEYKPCRSCSCCDAEVDDDELLYEISSGYFVCGDCFYQFVEDNYSPASLADQLDINYVKAGELNE